MKKILLLGGTGLVGDAIYRKLGNQYEIVRTAGHRKPEHGWKLGVEETELLEKVLDVENPDIVISSVCGEFQKQMVFHEKIAQWLSGKKKRFLFMSTSNVFDGDLSKPWTEEDVPVPESDYGIFKRRCECMLQEKLSEQLIIFRLSAVWDRECPRLHKLKQCSCAREKVHTYPGLSVNLTWAEQIGAYAGYVLEHELTGVFHVGSTDCVDYFEFEKDVCGKLGIPVPEFEREEMPENCFQAVVSIRRDIPECLHMTTEEILKRLSERDH